MATSEGCCHLTGAMLNLAAEAADRARSILEKSEGIMYLRSDFDMRFWFVGSKFAYIFCHFCREIAAGSYTLPLHLNRFLLLLPIKSP
jgi:hypothetical protein